ncbi:Tyrosine-protein kinase receptor [Balamuthia mandrillaris]
MTRRRLFLSVFALGLFFFTWQHFGPSSSSSSPSSSFADSCPCPSSSSSPPTSRKILSTSSPSSAPPSSSIKKSASTISSPLRKRQTSTTETTITTETEQCLYFTNLNNRLVILSEKGKDIAEITIEGFYPRGVAVHETFLYVVTARTVERYNIDKEMERTTMGQPPEPFISFNNIPSLYCRGEGVLIFNSTIFVSCSEALPWGILRFNLNGTFISGILPLTAVGHMRMDWLKEHLLAVDYSDNVIYRLPIKKLTVNSTSSSSSSSTSSSSSSADAQPETSGSSSTSSDDSSSSAPSGEQQTTVYITEETFPLANFTDSGRLKARFQGMTYGSKGFLHVILLLSEDAKATALLDVTNLDNSSYIKNPTGVLLRFTTEENATFVGAAEGLNITAPFDIVRGPNQQFYITQQVFFRINPAILYYNLGNYQPPTGSDGRFYGGTRLNSIEPLYMAWGPCPVFPSTGTDKETLLAITVPVSVTFSIILCFLVLGIGGCIFRFCCWNRQKEWEGEDEGMEMGRRGKTRFTYTEIDPEDIRLDRLLGQGAFGKVYKGEWRGAPVAVKVFNNIRPEAMDESLIIDIKEEAQMMQKLSHHPNVVKFIGAVMKADSQLKFALVSEYCAKGSLYDMLMKRKEKVPLVVLVRMARDIAAGILHLHKEKVIHRDIAMRNVLVGENYSVYISDFGMARVKENQDLNTTQSTTGPVRWMAPESILHSEASDAFSYGVLLWEMITRKVPWRGLDAAQVIVRVSKENTRLKVPKDADPILAKIIRKCWKEKPEQRITFQQIVDKLSSHLSALEAIYGTNQTSESDSESEADAMKTYAVEEEDDGRSSSSRSSSSSAADGSELTITTTTNDATLSSVFFGISKDTKKKPDILQHHQPNHHRHCYSADEEGDHEDDDESQDAEEEEMEVEMLGSYMTLASILGTSTKNAATRHKSETDEHIDTTTSTTEEKEDEEEREVCGGIRAAINVASSSGSSSSFSLTGETQQLIRVKKRREERSKKEEGSKQTTVAVSRKKKRKQQQRKRRRKEQQPHQKRTTATKMEEKKQKEDAEKTRTEAALKAADIISYRIPFHFELNESSRSDK